MSEKHQANLPECFKECVAITSISVTDILESKGIVNDPNGVLAGIASSAGKYTSTTHYENGVELKESRVCFLDEKGNGPLRPSDISSFDYLIVGGILGDHPPKDKGGHLRGYNLAVRHLGPRQMSTDTAVLACATVLRHQISIEKLSYSDDPEVYADEVTTKDLLVKPDVQKQDSLYRESTAIRMRYLTLYQPHLKDFPPISLDSSLSPSLGDWTCTNQGFISLPNIIDELSPEDKQYILQKPRITPNLLEHIFDTADNGLFDFDGALDIDDGEFDEEDKKALDSLFM